jgi:DNA-directed RNA polymerase specialized sigma subunit
MDNLYKKTERWYYRLNALKTRIENLKQEYAEKELEATGEGIDYSKDKLSETYKFSSTTESIGIELAQIKMKIEMLQNKVDIMERSLRILNQTEIRIITMKYLQNEPWYKIAYEMKYNEAHCRRIRTHAIEKLKVAIFGEGEEA